MDLLKEFESDNIYTRHVREEHSDGSGYTMHIHERCEIYFFAEGNARYLVEGSEYVLSHGSTLIIRPGEVHRPKLLDNGVYERFAVNFPISLFDDIDPERRIMRPFTDRALGTCNLYEKPEYEELFLRLSSEYDDVYGRRVEAYSILLQMMTDIGRDFSSVKKGSRAGKNAPAGKILKYINDHLYEDISVPALAENFYISTSGLNRIIRSATGASPWEYIIAKRLIAAGDMIRDGVPAGEAAESVGFSDYSSFYRAYVKRYGLSPRDKAR